MTKIADLPTFDMAEHLTTEDEVAAYLSLVLEEHDPAELAHAIDVIARASSDQVCACQAGRLETKGQAMNAPRDKSYDDYLAQSLTDPSGTATYLDAFMESRAHAALLLALRQVTNVHGMAEKAGDEMTSPPNSGLFKTRVTVAFRQAQKGTGEAMKRSRFSEEQIAYALRLADPRTPVVDGSNPEASCDGGSGRRLRRGSGPFTALIAQWL